MPKLVLICQSCRSPITIGHLGVDIGALAGYRAAVEQWEADNPGAGPMGALLDLPEQVAWQAHCEKCDPHACGYSIQSAELATYKGLLKWTAHLMGKAWLADTDWDELLEQVVDGTDERLREVKA